MKSPAIPLSVAFGVASAVAFAQTNDPVAQLRACSVMERAERLKCLDNLSRNIDPAVGPAPASNWIVSETTSPVDYTPIVAASTSSSRPGQLFNAAGHFLPERPHRDGGHRIDAFGQRRGLHRNLQRQWQ